MYMHDDECINRKKLKPKIYKMSKYNLSSCTNWAQTIVKGFPNLSMGCHRDMCTHRTQ